MGDLISKLNYACTYGDREGSIEILAFDRVGDNWKSYIEI